MCNRSIVSNGCSGNCCAAVYFPYTIEDLKRIKEAKAQAKSWVDEKGRERSDYPTDERVSHDYLIDMIVPLGWSTIDPETGKSFRNREEEDGNWGDEGITNARLNSGKRLRADGEIEGYIITCKHFDPELRICNDYDNRPGLCRRFGATCKYLGCTCAKQMAMNSDSLLIHPIEFDENGNSNNE